MTKYEILDTIMLGFLTHNDSYDALIDNGYVYFNGTDIVFIDSKGKEHISHTMSNALNIWEEQGKIKPI